MSTPSPDVIRQLPKKNGSAQRYRLRALSWLVVREPGQAHWPRLNGPHAVAPLLPEILPDDDREHFVAIFLDAKCRYLGHHEVSVGGLTGTMVGIRELFRATLLAGAGAVILAHNHPSGDPTPSREDLQLTRTLAKAGALMDLPVRDHLIWGSGSARWVSLAERGVLGG